VVATPPPFVTQVPRPFVQPDPDDDPVSDVPPDDERPVNRRVPPPIRLVGPNGQVVPQPYVEDDDAPQQPATAPTPANPFGVMPGTPRPGMVTPAPQQQQQQQPPQTVDPEP
jgi:hypothetical protein